MIPELIEEIRALENEVADKGEFPLILLAGERRSYNATAESLTAHGESAHQTVSAESAH